jgi:hypothetical protein
MRGWGRLARRGRCSAPPAGFRFAAYGYCGSVKSQPEQTPKPPAPREPVEPSEPVDPDPPTSPEDADDVHGDPETPV